MKEQEILLNRAEEALKSAELLLKEQFYDASISRSYYAIFYSAQAVLMSKNLKFASHKSVISLFGKYFVKTGLFKPELGKILNRAFEKRLASDYLLSARAGQKDAKEVLDWAKNFIQEAKNFLAIAPK